MAFLERFFSALRDWWIHRPESQQDMLRVGLRVVLLAVVAMIGWHFAKPHWPEWRERFFPTEERTPVQLAEQEDYVEAVTALRELPVSMPTDPAVWRRAAVELEAVATPVRFAADLSTRQQSAAQMGLQIARVLESLRIPANASAADGLARLQRAALNDSAYYRLLAGVALALGREHDLDRRLQAFNATLEYTPASRFNIAALRLWSADAAVVLAARNELGVLCAADDVHVRAALERLSFAARSSRSEALAEELAYLIGTWRLNPDGSPLRRTVLEPAPGWDLVLGHLQEEAANSPYEAALLARWLAEGGYPGESLQWLLGLPTTVTDTAEVLPVLFDLTNATGSWAQMRTLLLSGRFGAMPAETTSLLLASRMQDELTGTERSQATWEDAVTLSQRSLPALRMLARVAQASGDGARQNLVLEQIVQQFPAEFWAYQALMINHAVAADMDALWELYQIWAQRMPDHGGVQAAWLMLAALNNRGAENTLRRADDLWNRSPRPMPADIVLAVVAAVWRWDSATRAARYLEQLPVEAEGEPRTLLWRSIIAADTDDEATLRYALRNLDRGRLLPVEERLLSSVLAARDERQARESTP